MTGVIVRKSSHLPDLGSGLPGDINAASTVIHAKHFLSNKWTDCKICYLPFLRAFLISFLSKVIDNNTIKLVIEGSQMRKRQEKCAV